MIISFSNADFFNNLNEGDFEKPPSSFLVCRLPIEKFDENSSHYIYYLDEILFRVLRQRNSVKSIGLSHTK